MSPILLSGKGNCTQHCSFHEVTGAVYPTLSRTVALDASPVENTPSGRTSNLSLLENLGTCAALSFEATMRVYEIAQLVDGELYGDGDHEICNVADLGNASSSELTFAEGERALQQAAASQAGCILIPEGVSLRGHTVIRVKHPKLAFIAAANALHPSKLAAPGIHPTAVLSPTASVPASASIGPHVTIEDHATIGERCILAAGVFIGVGVEIGPDCMLYPGVRVYPGAQIGSRVTLHAGVVIGGDGFGYVFAEGRHHKFPQLGKVIIEDDVEIGCNTTVDRGSLGTTFIGSGTKIDNLVQIAHNVR